MFLSTADRAMFFLRDRLKLAMVPDMIQAISLSPSPWVDCFVITRSLSLSVVLRQLMGSCSRRLKLKSPPILLYPSSQYILRCIAEKALFGSRNSRLGAPSFKTINCSVSLDMRRIGIGLGVCFLTASSTQKIIPKS